MFRYKKGQYHLKDCEERYQEYLNDLVNWVVHWPNHCGVCGASGVIEYREYRGEYHGAPAYENMADPCPGRPYKPCSEEGNCPRCGQPGLMELREDPILPENAGYYEPSRESCKYCGWSYFKGPIAPYFECHCYHYTDQYDEIIDKAQLSYGDIMGEYAETHHEDDGGSMGMVEGRFDMTDDALDYCKGDAIMHVWGDRIPNHIDVQDIIRYWNWREGR